MCRFETAVLAFDKHESYDANDDGYGIAIAVIPL